MSKYDRVLRPIVIMFIVYTSLVGGVIETNPLMKISHQIGYALIIAVWLWHLARSDRGFPLTRLNMPLWGLGFGWLVAAIFGADFRVSFEFVWMTFVHIMLFFIFVDFARKGRSRWLLEGLFITSGVIVILGIVEMIVWYFGMPVLAVVPQGWPQIDGFTIPPVIHELSIPLSHNNPTAAYTVLMIPLALGWGSTTAESDLRWGLRILAASLLGILLLTQSRGAYLALASILGTIALLWVVRPDVRGRFPHKIQLMLAPRNVIIFTLVGCLICGYMLYLTIVATPNPNLNDITRLDLWHNATEIFRDHPLTGVGPFLFRAERLKYGLWEKSYIYVGLDHAHNALLNLIAEGGLIVLVSAVWVIVRLGHIGWNAWRTAPPAIRRRLEAVLIACVGFFVHNQVDAFFQTQLTIPILIVAAYVVACDPAPPRPEIPVRKWQHPARLQFALSTVLLVASQVVFVPIGRGALAQQRALLHNGQDEYLSALEASHDAQKADPWLGLYDLEEATTLGYLAVDDPENYLDAAIQSFESSLDSAPTWDVGWHNLAALYAQANDYTHAVEAEEHAVMLYPLYGYLLKLGEYYDLSGNPQAARNAYFRALKESPWLAGSDFWDREDQREYLDDALVYFGGSATEIDLLVYSGNFEQIPHDVSANYEDSQEIERRLSALWPDSSNEPCIYCYHVMNNPELLDAESILHTQGYTSDDTDHVRMLANKAIFLGGEKAEWGWYVLVRLAQIDTDRDQIETYLMRSVRTFNEYQSKFARIYRMAGSLRYIPQARTPMVSSIAYDPLIMLAELQMENNNREALQETYDMIWEADPYAVEANPIEPVN